QDVDCEQCGICDGMVKVTMAYDCETGAVTTTIDTLYLAVPDGEGTWRDVETGETIETPGTAGTWEPGEDDACTATGFFPTTACGGFAWKEQFNVNADPESVTITGPGMDAPGF